MKSQGLLPLHELHDTTDLVWVVTGFLGDIVLATAAFQVVAKHVPHVRQHVITTPLGVNVLAGAKVLDQRIVFDKRGRSTWSAFKDTASELKKVLGHGAKPVVLQAHRSFRSSLLTRYLRLPTVTYWESQLASHAISRVARVATFHEAVRIALLLEPLGIPRDILLQAKPVLDPLPLTKDGAWQERLKSWHEAGQRLVGIAPGSVWGTKRWTKKGFVELTQRLLSQPQDRVILLGSNAEKVLCHEIVQEVRHAVGETASQRLMDLSGTTSLDDLRRIYPMLSLLVSNDSSPLHYASAFDTPTVAIFGATIPEMGFGPLASRSKVLGVELPCRPCSDHGPATCPLTHFRCMRDLSAEQVFAALQNL